MRTIIAGGRDFKPSESDYTWLDEIHKKIGITVVVSGRARGADIFGELWAKSRGIDVDLHPADWSKYGNSAGPIRNREMAENADACILFAGGKGTENMRQNAKRCNLLIFEREGHK